MVSARSARLCARSGGGRRHLVGYGLGRGRKTGIVNDNTWGLPHLVRTRCFVNYNTWGLTGCVVNYKTWGLTDSVTTRCVVNYNTWGLAHLVRTGCVVNYSTWGFTHLVRARGVVNYNTCVLTHLVTGRCFETCSRTYILLGESSIWIWILVMQKQTIGHRDCIKPVLH